MDADSRFLFHRAADELLERLDLVARPFAAALDLGCGDGYLTDKLRARGLEVIAAGRRRAFRRGGGIQSEEDRLPFADGAASTSSFRSARSTPSTICPAR